MILIFIADGWGPKYGGINSFNYDLCLAVSNISAGHYRTICVVPDATRKEVEVARSNNLELVVVGQKHFEDNIAITERIKDISNDKIKIWIGHDVKTGFKAVECAELTYSKSAIVHHMNYRAYYAYITNSSEKIIDKENKQEKLMRQADLIYAVGPKLLKSADDILSIVGKYETSACELLPGLSDITPISRPLNNYSVLSFGRVTADTDIIKQTKLAVAASCSVVSENGSDFGYDTEIKVIGVSEPEIKKSEKLLNDIAHNYSGRRVNLKGLPYSEDRTFLFNELRKSSVCMMLSLHEGFGLVGMEAVSAGVPLIVSKNSGFYNLLERDFPVDGQPNVISVDIKGGYDDDLNQEDLNVVKSALVEIKKNETLWKEKARKLKELISNKLSWENTAKSFINHININLDSYDEEKLHEKKPHVISNNSTEKLYLLSERSYSFKKKVLREYEIQEFKKKLPDNNVLSISGLKGSGKTFFAESFFHNEIETGSFRDVLFYECTEGETFESFVIAISTKYSLAGNYENLQITDLVQKLAADNIALVLNKFHRSNSEGFEQFLNYSLRSKHNITIVLICDFINDILLTKLIDSIVIQGFKKIKIKEFLNFYGIKLHDKDIEKLKVKTGGQPQALTHFVQMINQLNYRVSEILNMQLKNMDDWIRAIDKKLSQKEKFVMQVISLIKHPFNEKFILKYFRHINRIQKKFNLDQNSFYELKKKFIVQKLTQYNYYIIDTLSEYYRNTLDDKNLEQECYSYLASYSKDVFYRERKREDTKINLTVKWLKQACYYYQLSGNYENSIKLFSSAINSLKRTGNYSFIIDILRTANSSIFKDPWMIYNLIDSYINIGELYNAEIKLDNYLRHHIVEDKNCELQLNRLHSIILHEKGFSELALNLINSEIKKAELNHTKIEIINQALQSKALFEYTLNKFDVSIETCNKIKKNSTQEFSLAIVQIILGMNLRMKNNNECIKMFRDSYLIFVKFSDVRGATWASMHLCEAELYFNVVSEDIHARIIETIDLKEQFGDKSRDYNNLLNKISSINTDLNVKEKLEQAFIRFKDYY